MEQLNKVMLRGIAGAVRLTEAQGRLLARLSIATTRAFLDSSRTPVLETTWHDVSMWEGKDIPAGTLRSLSKGDKLYVEGRIRQVRYTGADGKERTSMEILATKLEKLEEDSQNLQFEDGREN